MSTFARAEAGQKLFLIGLEICIDAHFAAHNVIHGLCKITLLKNHIVAVKGHVFHGNSPFNQIPRSSL